MKFIFRDIKECATFIHNLAEQARVRRSALEAARPNAKRGREWHSLTAEMHAYWNASEILQHADFNPNDKEQH